MQLRHSFLAVLSLGAALPALGSAATQSWGFRDATVSIKSKGGGVQSPTKERFTESNPVEKELSFASADVLRLQLTTMEGREKRRPHQAFLLLGDAELGLDVSYPLKVEESGKAKIELNQNELPVQFLQPHKSLDGRLLVASFGETRPLLAPIFKISIDVAAPAPLPEPKTVTHRLPEIHHIFKTESTSPPAVICAFFVVLVLATPPVLFGLWLTLGANLKHLPTALCSAPVSHILFLGSITGIEGLLYLYYTHWNLFELLPVALGVGLIAVLSGSRALGEVQSRRLAGMR